MDENDKKEFLDDFRKADGTEKLDMWYYALEQEVTWEQILADMSTIAKEQKVDKQLDKMMEDDLKNIEE
jgi:hypothetical protein